MGKRGCQVQEQRQLRLLSTQTRANEVPKHKNKGKCGSKAQDQLQICCKLQEQRQMRFLSTRTSVNYVAKHKNNDKRG